jgi:hypothetical protein
MNVLSCVGFSRARLFSVRLLSVATMVMVVLASVVVSPRRAAAQMEFDFNGDGSVTCADFEDEFPDTFTDEATEALRQYPDDLSNLNRDSEDDDIACEGQPASGEPESGRPESESPPAQTPVPESPAPAPVAAAPAPSSAEAADLPADVMARVEGCAVIAISPHDVVGAGCPGVGVVTYRVPDGAPLLEGTVIMNPGAAQAAEAGPTREATAATGTNGSAENANREERAQESAGGGNKDKATKQQSADDTKAKQGKGKKQESNDKNKDKGKKKGGKNKSKKQDSDDTNKDKNNKKGGKNKDKKDKKRPRRR